MVLWNMLTLIEMEGLTNALPIILPHIIDAIIVATVTITAFVLALLAYRNTKKILKQLEEKEG